LLGVLRNEYIKTGRTGLGASKGGWVRFGESEFLTMGSSLGEVVDSMEGVALSEEGKILARMPRWLFGFVFTGDR